MFINIYHGVLKTLTRTSRKNLVKLSVSILSKFENSKKFSKKETDLIKKIDNFITRSHYEDNMTPTRNEILDWCSKLYESKLYMTAAQSFVMDATKQSASEKAQLETMSSNGFTMEKLPASGKNSLRFDENCISLVNVKVEGVTSRSFDYQRKYSNLVEYFFGKVCFSQGGHQNGVKSELINFLKSANKYLQENSDCNFVFTALVDGDSLTQENINDYQQFLSSKVRLMNCDSYKPFDI